MAKRTPKELLALHILMDVLEHSDLDMEDQRVVIITVARGGRRDQDRETTARLRRCMKRFKLTVAQRRCVFVSGQMLLRERRRGIEPVVRLREAADKRVGR